jgi:hypothetical protein
VPPAIAGGSLMHAREELDPAGNPELRVGRGQMAPDRGFRERKSLGDVSRRQTLDGHVEHLRLSWREHRKVQAAGGSGFAHCHIIAVSGWRCHQSNR